MKSLYVHIPFCRSKCFYCDFYSLPDTRQAFSYTEALVKEIRLKGRLWGTALNTIYFGGGTPSCLEPQFLAAALRECGRFFSWQREAEVTLEANPGTVSREYLSTIHALGFNRLSIGLQAVQDAHLQALGRGHTLADFLQALHDARAVGFTNISVDVIYGLPLQTEADYLETLQFIAEQGVEHISVYALQIEPDTPLYNLWSEGRLALPDDDAVADMMIKGRDYLLTQGYCQYEISNFARPGFESRHNLTYWHNQEYLGLGPSAASYVGGRRFVNVADLALYMASLAAGHNPIASCEHLTPEGSMAETMILGLRMLKAGVNRAIFRERYGVDPGLYYQRVIDKWQDLGFIEVTPETIRLTPRALPLASQVQLDFLP